MSWYWWYLLAGLVFYGCMVWRERKDFPGHLEWPAILRGFLFCVLLWPHVLLLFIEQEFL